MTIIYNMSNAEYHASVPISKSKLDDLDRSPYIFWKRHKDPNRPQRKATAAMSLGTMVHCAVLEPHEFIHRYRVGPLVSTKNVKAWKDFVAELPPGVDAITEDENQQIAKMADSLRALPQVAAMLENGRAEVSAFWTDKDTGVECRCRPDWVSPAGKHAVSLLDVKTCLDASAKGFAKSAATYQYDKQNAFYADGYAAASGLAVDDFLIAAVESVYPYAATTYRFSVMDIAVARDHYKQSLALYKECEQSGVWPGYPIESVLELPSWYRRQDEEVELTYAS